MSFKLPQDKVPPKCRIAEIVQYSCEAQMDAYGRPQLNCFPFPRILRICEGRPAVEITRQVDIDVATGEVHIPTDARYVVLLSSLVCVFWTGICSQKLPRAKVWRDIVRTQNDLCQPNSES
ncbi:hypothetical protein OF83DRAFT_311448 [Amylostereum chailletii]|nr:hypothetical protein OF83DRAFT_311448 [Amylostereum chailletii]